MSIESQNQLQNLKLLAAESALYSKAKIFLGLQYLGLLFVSFGGLFCAMMGLKVSPISFSLALVDIVVINNLIKRKIKQAAIVQEMFDCDVLELPWSKVHVGSRIPLEKVELESSGKPLSNYKNWYASEVFNLPSPRRTLICQRSNIVWQIIDKERFVAVHRVALLFLILFAITTLFISDLSSVEWFYTICLTLFPLANRLLDNTNRLSESITSLESLRVQIDSQLNNTSDLRSEVFTREIQSRLFDIRCRDLPVWDWFYSLFKSENENAMIMAAENIR